MVVLGYHCLLRKVVELPRCIMVQLEYLTYIEELLARLDCSLVVLSDVLVVGIDDSRGITIVTVENAFKLSDGRV